MITLEAFNLRLKRVVEFYKKPSPENNYAKLTNRSFAQRWGVKERSFYQYLSGDVNCDIEVLIALANAFPEVNMGWLITGLGPMTSGVQGNSILLPAPTEPSGLYYKEKLESVVDQITLMLESNSVESFVNNINLIRDNIRNQ